MARKMKLGEPSRPAKAKPSKKKTAGKPAKKSRPPAKKAARKKASKTGKSAKSASVRPAGKAGPATPKTPRSYRNMAPSPISSALLPFLRAGEISGAVTLVADEKGPLHFEAHGVSDLSTSRPMEKDAIFAIASMTKPITTAAVLLLRDEGRLSIEDPVGRFLPELARLKTEDGAERVVTIQHLLTHTSGMGEPNEAEWAAARSLADLVPAHAAKPLRFVPGSQWAYCQSSLNTAARVVEVVSGKSFPDFLRERIYAPLGMTDTGHWLREEQAPRLARLYARDERGALVPAANRHGSRIGPTDRGVLPMGNAGLYATAGDYERFARMLLCGGRWEGRVLLHPTSIALMGANLTGELKAGFTPGCVYGLGCGVVREPQGVTAMLSRGTFGHGGAFGTQAWIDPVRKRVHLLMVQRSNFPNADASEVRAAFHRAAAAL